jgi:hypothetical protein
MEDLMKKFLFTLLLIVGTSRLPCHAVQVVLDFESVARPGSASTTIASYVQDGFEVTAIDPFHPGAADLSVWGTQSENFNGSTALFATVSGSPITLLRRSDNGAFDLTSIDLGPAFASAGTGATVAFTGSRADGTTVTEEFTFSGNLTPPTTFQFDTSFHSLFMVGWKQGDVLQTPHQFDNITLNLQPIPEPTVATLLLVGLVGFGAILRARGKLS